MIEYIPVSSSRLLPEMTASRPFKAVLIAEEAVTPEQRTEFSRWLIESGCLYLMAWGDECGAWAAAVHRANLAAFDFDEIPDDRVVITTWHERESLRDVLWFSKHTAMHPCSPLDETVLLHLSPTARAQEIVDEYLAA